MRTAISALLLPLLLTGILQAAELFPLSRVDLAEGPFLNALDRDAEYILIHEVDRFLVPFHEEAGLPAMAAPYPNWESTGLDGHVGGHYLTALAQMAVVTGDPEFRRRLDYMVAELARCQDAIGTGYVGGVRGARDLWKQLRQGDIRAEPFSLNDVWVPWYNLHKTFAGLRDAWRIAGNHQAREVLLELSEWCVNLLDEMTAAEVQEMMICEHGGMNEVLADVHEMTGEERFLLAARKFSDQRILAPLLNEEDTLTGLHANTQIPKVVGFARTASLSGEGDWMAASRFFWKTVVDHRSVSIGGNSVSEHFHPRNDFMPMIEHHEGPETCNTYNMLKLSELLFREEPEAELADYYERALYNHILSSQHPDRGGFVYFTPMRPRHYRVYSQPGQCFWCCVGSGMENHGKYGRFIYAHENSDTLYVNLFIPSTLHWEAKHVKLHQVTGFPAEPSSRLITEVQEPTRFTVKIRRPSWVPEDAFAVTLNGKSLPQRLDRSGYLVIDREWKTGDSVEIPLPLSLKLVPLPDGSPYASILYGPLVLAACVSDTEMPGLIADDGRTSHIASGPRWPLDGAPAIAGTGEAVLEALRSSGEHPLAFDLDTPEGIFRLRPFHQVHDCRYMIYWRRELPHQADSPVEAAR